MNCQHKKDCPCPRIADNLSVCVAIQQQVRYQRLTKHKRCHFRIWHAVEDVIQRVVIRKQRAAASVSDEALTKKNGRLVDRLFDTGFCFLLKIPIASSTR